MAGAAASAPAPAAAAGASFDLAPVVALLTRQVAAVEPPAGDGRPWRIDDAQLDFNLVEVGGKGGTRLAVPAADFDAGRDGAARPPLRRHVSLDLLLPRPPAPLSGTGDASEPPAPQSPPEPEPAPPLARTIGAIIAAARQGAAADPAFDTKRLSVDLEFALERDARGAPSVVVFALDRRIAAANVHKLRLKLSGRERARTGERSGDRSGDRTEDRAEDDASDRSSARRPAVP